MKNPIKDEKGSSRINRGGRWDGTPTFLRSSYRDNLVPTRQINDLGFRLVKNIPQG